MHALRTIARLSLALSLAACGGGNGGSTDPVPPPAVPPLIQFEAVYDLAGPPPTNRSISLRQLAPLLDAEADFISLQQPVPRMKERNPEVEIPEPLEALVMRCLSKDPDGRPATMDVFVQQLSECARSIGVSGGFTQAVESLSGITSFRGTMKALKEAETLPASSEEISAVGARASSPGSPPSADKNTEKAVVATPAPEPAGSKKGMIVVVALVAVAAVGGFLLLGKKETPAPTAAPTPPSSAAATQEKGRESFTMMIESMPAGASVMEDGQSLGTTPLQLSVQNDKVRAAPRRITVQKEGFQAYSIVQGPSEESVRVVATLVAVAKEEPKPEPEPTKPTGGGRGPRGPKPGTTATTTTKPPSGPEPPDIAIGR